MARNGGTLLTVMTTSRTRGSRLSGVMLKAFPRISRAWSVLTSPWGSALSPIRRKMTRLIRSAGLAVQNMLRMCRPTVRPPPTRLGTRMVVSESGIILSPK
jgi:hypothetical protein